MSAGVLPWENISGFFYIYVLFLLLLSTPSDAYINAWFGEGEKNVGKENHTKMKKRKSPLI